MVVSILRSMHLCPNCPEEASLHVAGLGNTCRHAGHAVPRCGQQLGAYVACYAAMADWQVLKDCLENIPTFKHFIFLLNAGNNGDCFA